MSKEKELSAAVGMSQPASDRFMLEKANQHIEKLNSEIKELTWAAEKHRDDADFYRKMIRKILA